MLVTILEGRVTSERWSRLSDTYRKGIKTLPLALIKTFLLQDQEDHNTWRIVSEWRSKEEYGHSAESREHDAQCMEMFRQVGVEPTYRTFLVRGQHTHV